MVDFAHTYPNGPDCALRDENYLLGLNRLIHMLEDIVQPTLSPAMQGLVKSNNKQQHMYRETVLSSDQNEDENEEDEEQDEEEEEEEESFEVVEGELIQL